MLRVLIAGVTGWTGVPLAAAVEASDDLELAGGIARHDADFASVEERSPPPRPTCSSTAKPASYAATSAALAAGLHVVVGTSGLSADDYAEIDAAARAAGRGVIAAGNLSVLAATLLHAATLAARHVDHWEVIDYGSTRQARRTERHLARARREARRGRAGRP